MKKLIVQIGLILLAIAVILGAIYLFPVVLHFFFNTSYRFVVFFLLLILLSNILAKITYKYFEI